MVSFCYGLNMKYTLIDSHIDIWFPGDDTNLKGSENSKRQILVGGSSPRKQHTFECWTCSQPHHHHLLATS